MIKSLELAGGGITFLQKWVQFVFTQTLPVQVPRDPHRSHMERR